MAGLKSRPFKAKKAAAAPERPEVSGRYYGGDEDFAAEAGAALAGSARVAGGGWAELCAAAVAVDWAGLAVAGGGRGASGSDGGVPCAGRPCDEHGAGTHADGGGYAGC